MTEFTHAFLALQDHPVTTVDNDVIIDVDLAYSGLGQLQELCHALAGHSGWWDEYNAMPMQYRKHFIAGKIGLVHSEASEALEGFRKSTQDDHLPHRKAVEVEFADVIIRVLDLAGAMKLDVAGAIIEKLAYNQRRKDHTREHREAEGGKTL